VQLSHEAPLPVPGCFDVRINLFGTEFLFGLDKKGSLPSCAYSVCEVDFPEAKARLFD
jgi:hypothetical protein